MKKILTAILLVSTLTFTGGVPQLQAQYPASTTPEPTPKVSAKTPKTVTVGGRVSSDRLRFISEKDLKVWKIANPDALKGYESERVKMKAVENPANGSMTVQSVHRSNETFSDSNF